MLLYTVNVKEELILLLLNRVVVTGKTYLKVLKSRSYSMYSIVPSSVPSSVSALPSSTRNRPKSFLHCDPVQCSERLGRRWQFIVANRQSRGFTPQVNEWLSTVISPNTDYQMFFKERHWNTYEAILTAPCRICNAIMPLSNKTN